MGVPSDGLTRALDVIANEGATTNNTSDNTPAPERGEAEGAEAT